MESRSAPVSNEDNRPETSTSEIIPAWRIRIEKFAVVTVLALSAGGDHSTCGTRKRTLWKSALVRQRRLPRSKFLLAHHDVESAPPAFRETDANDLQFG